MSKITTIKRTKAPKAPYAPPIPFEKLHSLILALQSGRELDSALRAEIATALNTLSFVQHRAMAAATPGRRVEVATTVAAYLVHLLHTEHGAKIEAAASAALPLLPGAMDERARDRLMRAYRKLKAADELRGIDIDPDIVADAVTRLGGNK